MDPVDNVGASKDNTRIACAPLSTCSLPVFRGNNLQAAMLQYQVVAGDMHLGHSVKSGHCRSFLTSTAASEDRPQRGSRFTGALRMVELPVVI